MSPGSFPAPSHLRLHAQPRQTPLSASRCTTLLPARPPEPLRALPPLHRAHSFSSWKPPPPANPSQPVKPGHSHTAPGTSLRSQAGRFNSSFAKPQRWSASPQNPRTLQRPGRGSGGSRQSARSLERLPEPLRGLSHLSSPARRPLHPPSASKSRHHVREPKWEGNQESRHGSRGVPALPV